MRRRAARRAAAASAGILAFAASLAAPGFWPALLRVLVREGPVLHPAGTPAYFVVTHLALVSVSSALTVAAGVPLGIWVTRGPGRAFRPMAAAAADLGQTFPPVAVLALTMPFLGFGFRPTIVALFLYGLFPVVSGTIAGLEGVPAAAKDAALGMGMSAAQMLRRVELPLASRVIVAGIRTSVVIGIGTATVGAAVGAKGLGVPIVGGLVQQNVAYVLEGAIPAAILAVLADTLLAALEEAVAPAVSEDEARLSRRLAPAGTAD